MMPLARVDFSYYDVVSELITVVKYRGTMKIIILHEIIWVKVQNSKTCYIIRAGDRFMKKNLIEEKMTDLNNYFKTHNDIATVYLFGSYGTSIYNSELSDITWQSFLAVNLPLRKKC